MVAAFDSGRHARVPVETLSEALKQVRDRGDFALAPAPTVTLRKEERL
jgi:hypothetical protein